MYLDNGPKCSSVECLAKRAYLLDIYWNKAANALVISGEDLDNVVWGRAFGERVPIEDW